MLTLLWRWPRRVLPRRPGARVAANLACWPGDFWVRVHAGAALAALGDREGAEGHFRAAADMAGEADDFIGRSDATQRLMRLRRTSAQVRHGQPMICRHQPKAQSRAQRRRKRQPGLRCAAAA